MGLTLSVGKVLLSFKLNKIGLVCYVRLFLFISLYVTVNGQFESIMHIYTFTLPPILTSSHHQPHPCSIFLSCPSLSSTGKLNWRERWNNKTFHFGIHHSFESNSSLQISLWYTRFPLVTFHFISYVGELWTSLHCYHTNGNNVNHGQKCLW